MPKSTMGGGSTGKGGLRDLLSSVAQQHLQPTLSPGSRQVGRRRSRIRSWIVHDKNKDKDAGDNRSDNSLHFTDTSDDDEFGGARNKTNLKGKSRRDDSDDDNDNNNDLRTPLHAHPHARNRNALNTASNESKMHMRPEDVREEEAVDMLIGVMGDEFDREVARRILRKYEGNVDKAAGALLEGERGEEMQFVGAGAQNQHQHQNQNQGYGQGQEQQGQGWSPLGTSGAASTWPMQMQTSTSRQGQGSQGLLSTDFSATGRPNTPIIDLTLEDDADLQRAMQESMNTLHASAGSQSQYAPSYTSSQMQAQSLSQVYAPSQPQGQTSQPEGGAVFGPSERSADPSWAMVPSQQNESSDANYLHNLNRAIEASLETMGDSDALEPFPVEQQLRRDGCPVVLRPSMHVMVYAASIIQGLFYVPQVRERMASWRPPVILDEDDVAAPLSDPDFTLWALSEIFTHMDLARLCDLNVDKRLPAFNIEPWDRPAQPPGELSRKFFSRLALTLEKAFIEQFARNGQPLPKPRLLHFQYGSGISEPGELLQEASIVPIDVNGGESNDLIGRLSAQLSQPQSEPGKQSVIFEPSEVVAFELVRSIPPTTTNGSGDRKAFVYPKSIYLDQFLRENVEIAQTKRRQRLEMFEEMQRLVLFKKTLTHFDGKDTLKDLRSTIFYYESVANKEDGADRGASIQATTRKLKSILSAIEDGIKAADEKIDTLRTQAETLLDCAELQHFKYDLRVVFVHDGLYGRKHLYSYVHDKSCWWKIADSLIEKVPEETVLNDQTGLHLGAGPYLLLYSLAIPDDDDPAPELPWIEDIKDDVRAANREFLSQLPPELVGDITLDDEDVWSRDVSVGSTKTAGSRSSMDVS